MRSKVKRSLLVGLVPLLFVPLLGCGLLEPLVRPAALSQAHAVAIIVVYALPSIDHYYEEAVGEEVAQTTGDIGAVTATGEWSGEYARRERKWTIRGSVITKNRGECFTVWTLGEADSEIHLIGFECE
jgi:hypothetical protein